MVEPITTGASVAAALSAGASAFGKEALGAAAKDAYSALKQALTHLVGTDADRLVESPDSKGRALIVAEAVDKLPVEESVEMRALSESLCRALKTDGVGAMVDNRITIIAGGGALLLVATFSLAQQPVTEKSNDLRYGKCFRRK